MINPTSSDAKDLIQLAERMGIPPEEAVRGVLQHLSEQDRYVDDPVKAVPSVSSKAS